jgi:hypothetical protein
LYFYNLFHTIRMSLCDSKNIVWWFQKIVSNLVDTSHNIAIFLESLHDKAFMRHLRKCIYDCLETIL